MIILRKLFVNDTLGTVHTLSPCRRRSISCSRATKQQVSRSSLSTAQHVGFNADSVKDSLVCNQPVRMEWMDNELYTWHFRQLSCSWILRAIHQEYTMIRCHDGNARTRIWHKYFCVDNFCIFRFLAHAKRMLILAEHIINEHNAVILNAKQLLGIGPTHR